MEIGFGWGPTVKLEVLVDPDFTALMEGAGVLAMLSRGIASGIVMSSIIVNTIVICFFSFSFFAPSEF